MAQAKTIYVCSNCGASSPKWFGRCQSCGEWNTCVEELEVKKSKNPQPFTASQGRSCGSKPVAINEISAEDDERIDTCSSELNRVLGGGLVKGSLVLVGGDPGIGKSTLMLQTALKAQGKKVLYVSGEESIHQLKMRSMRISSTNPECYILSETCLENIFANIKALSPDMVVIDSIQTIYSEQIDTSAGSIVQVRECTGMLLKTAKENRIPVFLVGHITKDGNIAGPKTLEHIVDTVLQFEGDRHYMYRILRATKNRFGNTNEIGIFEMDESGLREVDNPSELLLSQNTENLSGITIAAATEGIRSLLIEVQALTGTAAYGTPQRSATGFDIRRMNMLLAVLEKRAGFRLAQKDVFLNIAGGIKVNDPAIDLAVISSILSSNLDLPVSRDICLTGEVGLSGEIRPVNRVEQRISEAAKLGFKRILIPGSNAAKLKKSGAIEVCTANKVEEAFKILFSR